MRLGFCKNKESGRRELVLRPGSRESLSASRLLWLKANDCDALLACSNEPTRYAKKLRLHYDVDGLVSFKRYVRRSSLSAGALGTMLSSILQVVAWCVLEGVGYAALLFDERYVFVDGRASLHFVFVPLGAMELRTNNTPLTLLGALCNSKRLRLESPDAHMLCERLSDFVLEEGGIFSLNRFRDFVRTQTETAVPLDGARVETRGLDDAHGSQGCLEGGAGLQVGANTRVALNGRPRAASAYALCDKTTGVNHALSGNVVTLGRGAECDVRLCDHPNLSRMHALLRLGDEGMMLRDLNSSNGTHVDGMRLRSGEEMRVSYGKSFFLAGDEFLVKRREVTRWAMR